MKIINTYILILLSILYFGSCSGIRHITIETREPAQVTLPTFIKSVLVVNNVVTQPEDVGHEYRKIGHREFEKTTASSDSVAIYYTEAFSQFLAEEGYFERVEFYNEPIRKDSNFWRENSLDPEDMIRLRGETGTDAVISLDKLTMLTKRTDLFVQEGYPYGDMTGKINSLIRVYLPSIEGTIPTVQYNDSLEWEGFYIDDGAAYADMILPNTEDAMKELAVYAAEKMTQVFSPHWEEQDRWMYTPLNSKMREGEVFANKNQWEEAISKWEPHYNREKSNIAKAKTAHNIALAYEMLDNLELALEWATKAENHMSKSTSENSLDRRRSIVYKKEIARRLDDSNKLNMQEAVLQ